MPNKPNTKNRKRLPDETIAEYEERLLELGGVNAQHLRINIQWGQTPEFDRAKTKWLKERPKSGEFLSDIEQFGINLQTHNEGLRHIGKELIKLSREAHEQLQTEKNASIVAYCYERIISLIIKNYDDANSHQAKKSTKHKNEVVIRFIYSRIKNTPEIGFRQFWNKLQNECEDRTVTFENQQIDIDTNNGFWSDSKRYSYQTIRTKYFPEAKRLMETSK